MCVCVCVCVCVYERWRVTEEYVGALNLKEATIGIIPSAFVLHDLNRQALVRSSSGVSICTFVIVKQVN
jgi:hypothetical protein